MELILKLNLVKKNKEWIVIFHEKEELIENEAHIKDFSGGTLISISCKTTTSEKDNSKKKLLKLLVDRFMKEQERIKKKYDTIMSIFSLKIEDKDCLEGKKYNKYRTSLEYNGSCLIFYLFSEDKLRDEEYIHVDIDRNFFWIINEKLSYLPNKSELEQIKNGSIKKLKSEIDNEFKKIDLEYQLRIYTLLEEIKLLDLISEK